MVPNRYGKIVLSAAYSAAHWGLQSLRRTLAVEPGRFDINVNSIPAA